MRAIVLLILLATSVGQITIAGLANNFLSSGQHQAYDTSFSSSDRDGHELHFSSYHEASDLLIIEELFEEDTEETESDEEHSTHEIYACSRCEQIVVLKEAYNARTYLPSKKYLTYSSVPLWLLDEVFRL